ncbi:Het-C-domain-containing protein [Lentinula raphanica]|uniref:Het-C-domain-containing protein n=1 Tax=Lentinula raphanica TaxID=153919 RepID=A0AA38PN28_9AGAR|nr:Het-C-domain-containing protein [Lentinula raphanica]KAJ3845526.1 Het-C-domain-containing protein [Lentinula raphanica]KAJ3978150.1 Het-C-domain-containing protein [Lentinula raphanica]
MPNISTGLLLLTVIVILLPSNVQAFGAGDIPDFAYLNDKAFRHGDIENILEQVLKNAARAAGGGGLLGFARQALKTASGGSKFDKGDIKKVYFGNWLRDYSQAMDIAGLSKLTAETLVLVVSVLGFMTFGFATEEFEVTADRLGVYLPVEHIDNPKGYAEKEGDARDYHPKLRPPVDPRELEIDPRNGMKNYMATEDQDWDSSTAHIRRTFRACIEYGRRAGEREGADLWEAYRLLGTGLHTMEDLLAHSNWCEISLRKMGYSEVFCHVGENTDIDTPNGRAPPLVTGTFGSADFLHSLLGEATDHLSQASVTSLSQKMSDASNNSNASMNIEKLRAIFAKLPIGGSDEKMNQAEQLQQESKAYNFNPDDIAPPAVQKQLLEMLVWRDGIFRWITEKIEMIPGLSSLIDELTNALNAYVYTVIAPWLTPILTQATSVLGEGSKAVIDTEDQYEVFNNPDASDPSHSLLSKDHFGLILNEPAGKVAQLVVVYSTELIVKAWADDSDPDRVIDQILEAFHHPYFADDASSIQYKMFEEMQRWIGGLGEDEASQTIEALTKESVRNGKNKRLTDESEGQVEAGYGTPYTSQPQKSVYDTGYHDAGEARYGSQDERRPQYTSGSYAQTDSRNSDQYSGDDTFNRTSYRQDDEYNPRRGQQYSGSIEYGDQQVGGYGVSQQDNQNTYGYGQASGYGRPAETGYGRPAEDFYDSGRNEQPSYGMGGYQQQVNRQEYEDYEGRGSHRHEYDRPSEFRRSQLDARPETVEFRAGDAYGAGQYEEKRYNADTGPLSHQHQHGHGRRHHGSRQDEYAPSTEQTYGQYGSGREYGGTEDYRFDENNDQRRGDEFERGPREEEEPYEGGRRHNRPHGGHHGGHHGRGGRHSPGEDETFGAERLNINDEYDGRNRYY